MEPTDEPLNANYWKTKKQVKIKWSKNAQRPNGLWAVNFPFCFISFVASSLAQVLSTVVVLPGRRNWKGDKTCCVNWKINMSGRLNATRPLWRPSGEKSKILPGWNMTLCVPGGQNVREELRNFTNCMMELWLSSPSTQTGHWEPLLYTCVSQLGEEPFSPTGKETCPLFEELGRSSPGVEKWKVFIIQSRLTLRNPVDCSPPMSSVHRILQARILEWVAVPSSSESFRPRDPPGLLHCRWIFYPLSYQWSLDSLSTRQFGFLN